MPLSPEQRKRFLPVIDGILVASNLDEISAKRIRTSLQAAVNEDLTDIKQDVNELIMDRFDVANARRRDQANGHTNGASEPTESDAKDESATPVSDTEEHAAPPPRKKQKTGKSESDAALAARLQAEENGRVRPTRGGGTRKKGVATKKSPKKKKSATKVNSDDDSAEGSSGEKKASNRGGAFNKPWALSEPLAALLGETQLSRPQSVKRIWIYIKENGLQNESDKRQIHCDAKLRAVFNQENVHMFSMNKILSKHLYPLPEETES